MTRLSRKNKDNPYVLKYDKNKNVYTLEFIDHNKMNQKVEVSETIYKAFNEFELEDISQHHKFRKHIEHSELYETTLQQRMFLKPMSVEEEVENSILYDELKIAINSLSEVQRRRLKMYYFEDKTLREIAGIEGCSIKNVHKSITQAKENLRKKLKL